MQDINSIFSEDLTAIDISRPLLPQGQYELTVAECKVEPAKDPKKQNLNITLKTKFEAKSTKGDVVNPGFTLHHTVSLTPTEKYPADRIKEELKKFRLAVTGTGEGAFGDPSLYVGQDVLATLGIEEDKEGNYPPRNKVTRFIKREQVS